MSAEPIEDQVFNPAWMEETCGGDAAIVQELMNLFVTQANELWSGLARAVRDADWATADRAAHKMAGSCGACGLPALERALREFETIVASNPSAAPAQWPGVCAHADRAAQELNRRFGVQWMPKSGIGGNA